MTRMPTRLLGAACLALLIGACAQSNGDINRVQPNYIRKADLLDGQWYIRNAVVGASGNTGFTFTGEIGTLEKIVWEVQEDSLVGYRSYPYIVGAEDEQLSKLSVPSGTTLKLCDNKEGAEKEECVGAHPYYGAPVVVYPIKKHFDVQRTYDPGTGEQGNVIVENTSDRPWNEREYIRVDWSAQSMDKNAGLMWGTFGNPTGGSSLGAWIQANEPGTSPEDWPVFEYRGEGDERKLTYFDFTGRYYAKPDTRHYEGYGDIPLCYLSQRYDCTSQEVKMRTSLMRVDKNDTLDYEPLEYGNELMAKFGYFRAERLGYDRKFGYTDYKRQLLANRFNIWKHVYDRGDGSQPITVDAEGRITNRRLTMAEREPSPIVYYVPTAEHMGSQEAYEQYLEEARVLEKHWDLAFRRAVSAAQGKGYSREELEADSGKFTLVPQMLYICANPVEESSPEACKRVGSTDEKRLGARRLGDLRYSFLYTVTEPTPNGLLGYGPNSHDPETGEIISAHANTYTGAVDTQAQRVMDLINLIAGETSLVDHISGKTVRDYVARNSSYAAAIKRTSPTIQSALQSVEQTGQPTQPLFAQLTPRSQSVVEGLKATGLPQSTLTLSAQAEKLRQLPQLEDALLGALENSREALQQLPEPMAALAASNPELMREAQRMVTIKPEVLLSLQKQRIEEASRRNIYLAEFMDSRLMGYALQLHEERANRVSELMGEGKSALDARTQADGEMRRRLQQLVWRATSEHEFGHTIGLRHNFQGTYDAINFHDEYWQHRQNTLLVDQGGQKKVPMLPADLSAVAEGTESQLRNRMRDMEYSSIMDYHGSLSGDWEGVGKYDEAAILFAYSGGNEPGYVEVFTSARTSPQTFQTSEGTTLTLRGAGYDLPLVNAQRTNTAIPNFTERFHYSTVPLRFGEGGDAQAVVADGISKLTQRTIVPWSEVKKVQQAAREVMASGVDVDLASQLSSVLAGLQLPEGVSPQSALYEVPYMFCTDDHVGYVLSCNRFDSGADYLEMTRAWMESYWNGYYSTNFARDRYGYNPVYALYNSQGTFTNASMVYKHMVHAMYNAQRPGQQGFAQYSQGPLGFDPVMQRTWAMGSIDGINNLMRVMQLPTPGLYALVFDDADSDGAFDRGEEDRWVPVVSGVDFDNLTPEHKAQWERIGAEQGVAAWREITRGDGRRTYSRFDLDSGYLAQNRIVEAGHYYDQLGAMFAAVANPYQVFLGGDLNADLRRYSLPYNMLFKDELEQMFGDLWAQNDEAMWPTLSDDSGFGQVDGKDFVRGEKYFQGFQYPPVRDTTGSSLPAAPVQVRFTWTPRWYALYLGNAMFQVNFDMDFVKATQVVRVGNAESFEVAPGYTAVEVKDLNNGTRYIALQKDGGPETPAVKLVKWAAEMQGYAENPASAFPPDATPTPEELEDLRQNALDSLQSLVERLDVMRGMYSIFGNTRI